MIPFDREELRIVQLSLLKDFDSLCSRHGLRYYLAYGTLLGAIRHKGFIPWDDDIDVMMPRESYEQLKSILPPAGCYFIFPKEQRSLWLFTKFCREGTRVIEPNVREIKRYGVYIDIFPLDLTSATRQTMIEYAKSNCLKRLFQASYVFNYAICEKSSSNTIRKWVLRPLGRLHEKSWYLNRIERCAISNARGSALYYADWSQVRPFEISSVSRSSVETPAVAEFEGDYYPVPGNPEQVLERIYGSSWNVPIKRDLSSHGEAYWLSGYEDDHGEASYVV